MACDFLTFFHKRLIILNQFFTCLLYVPIYTRLHIFIQLSPTLTKLCHIKRDCLVHIICSKCPPSAKTHACRRLRKLLIALLIVVCGKSSQICCFYNLNKHVGYDTTSTLRGRGHRPRQWWSTATEADRQGRHLRNERVEYRAQAAGLHSLYLCHQCHRAYGHNDPIQDTVSK